MKVGRLMEVLAGFPKQAEVFRRDPKGSPDAVEAEVLLAERMVFVYSRDEQGSERLCLSELPGREPSRTFKAAVLEG